MTDVTILIPTYDGREVLTRLLQSLVTASRPDGFDWNVIVVDNNSADDTKAVVASFQEWLPMLSYLFEGRPGKCRALNRGLEECLGRFVAFLDHDVVVAPDYLVGLRDTLRDSAHNVFGGRVLARWTSPPPHWITGGSVLRTSRGGIIAHDYGAAPLRYSHEMRLPVGCNFFCRRSLFDRVGLFNVHLGPRPGAQIAGEESDVLRRFQAIGETILYTPAVTVIHPVDPARATKSYFRYRLFCDGRVVCRASLGQADVPTLLGVPRYLYRALAESAGRALLAAARLDRYHAFDHQLDMWYALGSIYEYRRIARRGLED